MVTPDGHDEGHTAGLGSAHAGDATEGLELVVVGESSLLGVTEGVGKGVSGETGDGGNRVLDDLTVLDVDTLDFLERAGVCAVGGDELSDDGHLCLGVDGLAGSVEPGVAHAVGVEVTTVLVADSAVPLGSVTTLGT